MIEQAPKGSERIAPHSYAARHQSPKTQRQAMGGGFDTANPKYWDSQWRPKDNAPDTALSQDLRMLRERCIDLVNNDPLAYGVIDTIAHGVIGTGPRPRSMAPTAIAETLATLWKAWRPVAGWDGTTSWPDVLRGSVHASCMSGDVLILWPDVGDGTGPRIDLVDARRVDTPSDSTPEVESARLGVGYDKYGRVQGYYVAKGEAANGKRTDYNYFPLSKNGRINARLFKRPSVMRPRQSRAIPMFAPAALDLKDLREYRRTEVRRAQMAAKINLIIKTPDPKSVADAFENLTADGVGVSEGVAELFGRSYGTTPDGSNMVLGLGEDAIVALPPQVNGGVGDYMEAMLRAVASCTGLPFEEAFRLYAKLNYSNARTIRLMAKSAYRDWRDDLEQAICSPTWTLLVQYWWANGLLGRIPWSPDLASVTWDWDEMEWVDPAKEVKANAEAIATGQKSLVDVCASQGKDARVIMRENLELERDEAAMREEMGLPPKAPAPGAAPAQPAAHAPVEPDDDDTEGDNV